MYKFGETPLGIIKCRNPFSACPSLSESRPSICSDTSTIASTCAGWRRRPPRTQPPSVELRCPSVGRPCGVVRQHWIEYLRSARLGDELVVATWVESVRRLSSLRRYAVLRNGELLTVGATEWVLVDYERRTPVQIPEEMRASFRLVAPDAEVLRDMGIRRMVRFAPSPGLAAASK